MMETELKGEIIIDKDITPMLYCELYMRDSSMLSTLTQTEYRVLCACIGRSNYYDSRGNEFIINSLLYEYAESQCGVLLGTIKSAIARLLRKGFLIKGKIGRGVYYLNPEYFFCGNVNDLPDSLMKVEIWRKKIITY